tara:strand:+ start:4722 stop:4976 length:255 start_codon:yes stop_codon:yes gene_type:complete
MNNTFKKVLVASVLAFSVIAPISVQADMLYQDAYDSPYGGSSYNQGRFQDNTIYGEGPYGGGVIRDTETGTNYNCDTLGNCHSW